ncbi:MAG: DUF1559 domain-containing protein [Gemmataceae bacterium]
MTRLQTRPAVTMVECLVVIALVGLLVGLMLPAIQSVRLASAQSACANQLRQMSLALHSYHTSHSRFPSAIEPDRTSKMPYASWQLRLTPYLDADPLWKDSVLAFQETSNFLQVPTHQGLHTVFRPVVCPLDVPASSSQIYVPQPSLVPIRIEVALTSYLGCSGTNRLKRDGVLFDNSRIRISDIRDGSSQTLAVGDRPTSKTFECGWWYAGVGVHRTGSLDSHIGVREFWTDDPFQPCPAEVGQFRGGDHENPCDSNHFWSYHKRGANFAFADGSVRFLTYDADSIFPLLATRAGGESVTIPD